MSIELNLEDLRKQFELFEIGTEKMDEIKAQIDILQAALESLTVRLTVIEKPTTVEEYKDEVPVATNASLTTIKAMPEFHGKTEEYPSWRNMITTAMKYVAKTDHETYLNALLMIKSKIRGPAAAILSNHATPLNFDAIIDRLDFSYADQRAMYVVEQELIVLQQGRMTVHEFYDKINEKLNTIITKIHMTHKEKIAADTLIENMRDKALRTFITGLSNNTGSVLYASNPKTLADAYARLQTILSDRERMTFAAQYNRNDGVSNYVQRNRSEVNQNKNIDQKLVTLKNRVQGQSQNLVQRNPNFTSKIEQQAAMEPIIANNNNKHDMMEVDASSMNVNVNAGENKRKYLPSGSNQYSRYHKFQRVNNIEGDDEYNELNDDSDETLSQASIFLES